MTQDLPPLPTSADELEAQIDATFNPPEPKERVYGPENSSNDSFQDEDYDAPEGVKYLEPEPEREPSPMVVNGTANIINSVINPKWLALGQEGYTPEQVEAMADSVGLIAAHFPNPLVAVMAKMEKASPLMQAVYGAGFTFATATGPMVLNILLNGGSKNVTPMSAGTEPDQDASFTGGPFDAAG